jgi:hypothetical protein
LLPTVQGKQSTKKSDVKQSEKEKKSSAKKSSAKNTSAKNSSAKNSSVATAGLEQALEQAAGEKGPALVGASTTGDGLTQSRQSSRAEGGDNPTGGPASSTSGPASSTSGPTSGKLICPECRAVNVLTLSSVQRVFVDAECIVCNTNRVEILLPACSHASLCRECAQKMMGLEA